MGKSKQDIQEALEAEVRKVRSPATIDVALGTYHLQAPIDNPEYCDKRVAREWPRAEELPAGEYIVGDYTHCLDEAYNGPPVLRMRRAGVYYEVNSWDPRFWWILDNATKLKPTPTRILFEERDDNYSLEILDKLFETGKITLKDFGAALQQCKTDWENREAE